MTDKKICVYAICKNEKDNVERWLTSMSEADYIVVLDTGSTDGTLGMLKNDPRVTRVESKKIKPWRFDVARNESLKLIPDDAEILVCTDFDEFFEEGWATVLRENWKDFYTRCHYCYAWSHNSLGEPQDVFTYDKIHTRGYHWIFPVHEVLDKDDKSSPEEILDVGEAIYLHHMRNENTDRTNYLPLLKLSVKENPDEPHCQMLYAREFMILKRYDESLKEFLKILDMPAVYTDERKASLIETYGRLGDLSFALGKYEDALHYYREFLKICNNHREPYFCMGEVYNAMGLYTLAIGVVESGIRYSTRMYDWIERKDNWIAKSDDILAVSYYYLGDFDKALEHIRVAYKHNPVDPRIVNNYKSILLAKEVGKITLDVFGE